MAAAVENITSDVTALESSSITVVGEIISDLADAAIEDPVVCYNYEQHNLSSNFTGS